MGVPVNSFIAKVEEIANEEPSYSHGKDGSNHECDCIGLIIGAIRRAGGNWRGIHGSNYAARSEMVQLDEFINEDQLKVGEAVYKGYKAGEGGGSLPAKYKPGGDRYNGDLTDYYHVGVVVSVNPLRIRHMTTPKPKIDSKVGKWRWHGELKKIDYGSAGERSSAGGGGRRPMEKATVVLSASGSGSTVNLRAGEGKDYKILAQVPIGTVVDIIQDNGKWCQIIVQGMTGWMMSNYLEYQGGGEELSGDILTAEEREKIDHALTDIENRIEVIRETLGRG